MPTADWDPEQYARFARERAQPFHDLLAMLEPGSGPVSVVDLGCGSGELTYELARRVRAASVVGLDNSAAMLAAARSHDAPADVECPVTFVHGDLSTWTSGEGVDLVVANASLQWVPDHAAVIARWASSLRPGGQLAIQVPANADHPSHLAAAEVAGTEPFCSSLGDSPPPDPVASNVLAPERYAQVLHELGFERQHVRLQVYPHVLASTHDVVEWTRGTSLTRFAAALPASTFDEFVESYRRALLDRIGIAAPYLYTFKRILLWAKGPAH